MSKKVPVETILKEYAKLGLTHRHNRCSECGRRLKLTPGAITGGGIGPSRFRTCRSCGFENPTLTQKVAASLESQGFEFESSEKFPPLGECLNCGKELIMSKDFTKVFCCHCGSAWDRFLIEEVFGHPLSPHLAGQIPIAPDNSKDAKELELLISNSDIDSGTAYRVIQVFPTDEEGRVNYSSEFAELNDALADFATTFKKSVVSQWTAPIKFVKKIANKETTQENAQKNDEKATQEKTQKIDTQYLAIYEDYIAHYIWNGENLKVSEVFYSDIFSDASAPLVIPFAVVTKSNKQYMDFMKFWAQFWIIYRSNLEPFKEVLFGDKAKAEKERLTREVLPKDSGEVNLAVELEKLAELHAKGVLTDDEFKTAKSRLLS